MNLTRVAIPKSIAVDIIRGSINKFVDKCNNFVMRWNCDFIFKDIYVQYNRFQELETSSCMRLCSMVTSATLETPHGALLFFEACFHVQNCTTSAFDIWQPLKLYHCIHQNQSFNLPSLYDANAFYVKMKLSCENFQWFCDMAHFYNGVMYWIANFNRILLFAIVWTGWNRNICVKYT